MKKYEIKFAIKVPEEVAEKDVEDWARFMCGDVGVLPAENPLEDESFDPLFGTFKIVRLA